MALPLLPEPLELLDVLDTPHGLTLVVRNPHLPVPCPACAQPSRRTHGGYRRSPRDTALGGRAVRLELRVRRFRCDNPACSHTTFAEPWPNLVPPRAQRTSRLLHAQRHVALALGGEAGRRLLDALGQPASADTLLRLIRATPLPQRDTPRVLGVDDFALKRGQTYGTILIDLEQHRVVDLLPDRTAPTLTTWLQAHPGVEIVSRDRSVEFARGATDGAPTAVQVADRFHLLQSLRQAVEGWLRRHRAKLRDQPASPSSSSSSSSSSPASGERCGSIFNAEPLPSSTVDQLRQAIRRRARRRELYDRAVELHRQGYSNRAIATITGVGRSVMDDWMRAEGYPQRHTPPSALAPHLDHIQQRLDEPDVTGRQIHDELVERGFKGSYSAVYRLITYLRLGHLPPSMQDQQREVQGAPAVQERRYSPSEGAWLFMRAAKELGERDRARMAMLYEKLEGSRTVQALVQTFTTLVCSRPAEAKGQFDAWLEAVSTSGVPELARLGRGLKQDYAAVLMAMTTAWSNGQTEGQVNRLKTLKRQMFGRAKFDVLRARVLLA